MGEILYILEKNSTYDKDQMAAYNREVLFI